MFSMFSDDVFALVTPPKYSYDLFEIFSSRAAFVFSVISSSSVHVKLSGNLDAYYEITIGTANNTRTVIQRHDASGMTSHYVHTPGIISGHHFRRFWLTWRDGHIKIGLDSLTTHAVVDWPDAQSFMHKVHSIGVTSDGSHGYWIIPRQSGRMTSFTSEINDKITRRCKML